MSNNRKCVVSDLVTKCTVFGCNSVKIKNVKEEILQFHVFPRPEKLQELWLIAIRREDLKLKSSKYLTKRCVVCSLHFDSNCYNEYNRLKRNSIPTKFENCELDECQTAQTAANHKIDGTVEESESKPKAIVQSKQGKQKLSPLSEIASHMTFSTKNIDSSDKNAVLFHCDVSNCNILDSNADVPVSHEFEKHGIEFREKEDTVGAKIPVFPDNHSFKESNHYKRLTFRLQQSRRQLKNSKRLAERLRNKIRDLECNKEEIGSKKHYEDCMSYVRYSLPPIKSELIANIIKNKNSHPDVVKDLALNLITLSPISYSLVKSILNLPCETSIRVRKNVGISHSILNQIRHKVDVD